LASLIIQEALKTASDTRSVVIGAGALASVADVFQASFGDQPVMVVADENTFKVAGEAVVTQLRAAGRSVETFIFPGTPKLHADYHHVEELREVLRPLAVVPVAVGSGTINDITKLAAHECGRPYMVVATAASMDGYVAFGAAITRGGFKQTMGCAAPRALVADADIVAAAPADMTASGYADLLGKVTAGADWILSDFVGSEPINQTAWRLVQTHLLTWLGQPEALRAGDPEAAGLLMEGLVLAGLAMQVAQSSRPASGSEHQFSHLWEMEGLSINGTEVSHGFKVGVGSLAVAALYDWVLAQDWADLDIDALRRAWPSRAAVAEHVRHSHPIPILAEKAVEMSLSKYITPEQLVRRMEGIREQWPALRAQLRNQMVPAQRLEAMLRAAGSPVRPEEIGLTIDRVRATYERARHIRSRYTVLDLIAEAGLLTKAMGSLFAPDGFWGEGRPSARASL